LSFIKAVRFSTAMVYGGDMFASLVHCVQAGRGFASEPVNDMKATAKSKHILLLFNIDLSLACMVS
jgi:hypothetical protein